jgi:phosphatidylglycerophosphate synthase
MGVAIISLHPVLTLATFVAEVSLVIAAALSDLADGYLARRWNVVSATGYVLDAMGDRAVHLSLILVMLSRYEFYPLIAWLLIFRDIAIYAVRVLTRNWLKRSRDHRWMSLLHAAGLRLWLSIYILRDGFQAFTGRDYLANTHIGVAQNLLIASSIIFSYWSLYVALNWIIDQEHIAMEQGVQ